MNKLIISILQCPLTGEDLRELKIVEINEINNKIKGGEVTHVDGSEVREELINGLVTKKLGYIYPIIEGVYVFLPDQAIALKN